MKKTILALLTLSLLTTAFVGCGKTADSSKTTVNKESEETPPTEKQVWLLHTEYSVSENATRTYYYDEFGNNIQMDLTTELPPSTATWLYEYDEHNNLTKRSVVSSGKDPFVQLVLTYDEDGKLMTRQEISTNSDRTYLYRYDDQNRIAALTTEKGEIVDKYIYSTDGTYKIQHGNDPYDYARYNADGQMLELRLGKEIKIVYVYNKDGNLTEAVTYNEYEDYETPEKTVYQLDEHGNAVKLIKVSSSGNETVIAEREYKLHTVKIR